MVYQSFRSFKGKVSDIYGKISEFIQISHSFIPFAVNIKATIFHSF